MLSQHPSSTEKIDFLSEGRKMGELIRRFDWAKTSLGPIEKWSDNLKNAIRLCVTSEFPTVVYCGPEYLFLYNDAYIPLVGRKHPHGVLGLPLSECRKEMWPILGPILQKVTATHKMQRAEELLLPLDLTGFIEEYYCTLSYTPIGIPGKTEAIFTNVYNNTAKVIQARHLNTLKEFELQAAEAKSVHETCFKAFKSLNSLNNKDIPFALLYTIDIKNNIANLACESTAISPETPLRPSTISLKETEEEKSIWPLSRIIKKDKYEIIDISKISSVPSGYWDEPPKNAIAIPVRIAGEAAPLAVLIAGISPRRHLNTEYLTLFNSIANLLATALSNAQAREKEQQRLQSLSEIDRAKTAFFGNVSHELRTPLTLILGPLEQILNDTRFSLASEQMQLLQMMLRNTRRLLKLVNNILDFARVEAHRMLGEYEPLDIAQYTNYLAGFFRAAIEKSNLKFIVDISHIDEPVYVDRSMWEKMIFNILSNAFKYTLSGQITIALKKQDRHIELSISDTGVGISEQDLPHIFERFYRVRHTGGRSIEGAGIGLSLAQELAKLHGGSIHVSSELDKGSTFTIRIPLGKDHLPENQIKATKTITEPPELLASAFVDEVTSWLPEGAMIKPLVPQPFVALKQPELPVSLVSEEKKTKILIVDDNTDMRIYLRSLLSPYWNIIEAANSEIAFELAKTQKPDLILTDIVMGKMSGLELASKLRKEFNTRLIPIILVSGSVSEESRVTGLKSGADDYLNKPFSPKELLARVRTQLELGKIRIELETTIEELKKANESLLKSKEQYSILTNMAPVGIFHLDQNGRATYVNPKGLNILGFTEISTQDLDPAWRNGLHPEDKERVIASWNKNLEEKLDRFKAEYRFVHKDNTVIWVAAEGITEKDSSGRITGYILTLIDITRLKELHDRQVRIVDSLCHELRNPLSGIQGNIELLLSYLSGLKLGIETIDQSYQLEPNMKKELLGQISESEESLDAMKKCAKQQELVTNDVLNFSRLEAGKVELKPRIFDPCTVLKDSFAMVQPDMNNKEMKKAIHHSILDFDVVGDPDRLKQVILNLLTNAIKFTEKGGKITLGFESIDQAGENCILKFFVEDTGIGMTPETQSKLFNRFAQAELRTFSEYGGSGLGLSISKQLVELMGGKMDITSTLGLGSRFTFTIQCKKQAKLKATAAREFKSEPTKADLKMLKGLIALIVEDNIVNQKLLKKLLEKYGIECYVAENGRLAVNLVKEKKNKIQIILMDVEMPILNGFLATKEIRQFQTDNSLSSFIIIGISGNARPEYAEQAKICGMDDYFTKPYDIEKIVARIKELITSIRSAPAPSQTTSAALPSTEAPALITQPEKKRSLTF